MVVVSLSKQVRVPVEIDRVFNAIGEILSCTGAIEAHGNGKVHKARILLAAVSFPTRNCDGGFSEVQGPKSFQWKAPPPMCTSIAMGMVNDHEQRVLI